MWSPSSLRYSSSRNLVHLGAFQHLVISFLFHVFFVVGFSGSTEQAYDQSSGTDSCREGFSLSLSSTLPFNSLFFSQLCIVFNSVFHFPKPLSLQFLFLSSFTFSFYKHPVSLSYGLLYSPNSPSL